MFVIDIAVPRNVDPAVNSVDNVFLYDIDDLQGVVNSNLAERQKEAARAETIVAEEVERMLARLKVQEVAPVIVSLQEQFEAIRSTEVAKALRKGGAMGEREIDALTRSDRRENRARTHRGIAPPGERIEWRQRRRNIKARVRYLKSYTLALFVLRLSHAMDAGWHEPRRGRSPR